MHFFACNLRATTFLFYLESVCRKIASLCSAILPKAQPKGSQTLRASGAEGPRRSPTFKVALYDRTPVLNVSKGPEPVPLTQSSQSGQPALVCNVRHDLRTTASTTPHRPRLALGPNRLLEFTLDSFASLNRGQPHSLNRGLGRGRGI